MSVRPARPVYVETLRVQRGPFVNYCYAVFAEGSRDAVLIDPAWELDSVEQALERRAARLRAVLLTHSHFDHVDLAEELSSRAGCPVFMSAEEAIFYGFQCRQLRVFQDARSLDIGDLTIHLIPTPGHTRGSVCYRIGGNVFTGDTLFAEGCGACIGPGADAGDLYFSVQRLKRELEPECRVFPGHCYGAEPGQRFESLLQTNIYLMFSALEQFVAFRMRANQKLSLGTR